LWGETLKTDALMEAFRGNLQLPEDLFWLYAMHEVVAELFVPAVRRAVGFAHIANAGGRRTAR
jgi:hypothetical protein